MLQKKTILEIKNVYTANAFQTPAGFFVGAGSETDPVVRLYDLDSGKAEEVHDGPGGMMSFIPVPGSADTCVTIMGLFPPFIGFEAGLFLHRKSNRGWETVKAMELPFAHRCEFISHGGDPYLVAATVSKLKENPADWSRPGEVHVISLKENPLPPWNSTVVDKEVFRNHGMIKTVLQGTETLFFSGEQGIFSVTPGEDGRWEITSVFNREVSEMTFMDLDGDGKQELITIEPFHGEQLNIYKKTEQGWDLRFGDSLSFGHGLSSGLYNGIPVIVTGNRSDSLALEIFTVDDLNKGAVKRQVIEADAGPTQTQVFTFGGVDYILSANQRKHEVALYSGSLDPA